MKNTLTLTNEQAFTLYDLLQKEKLDRPTNRNRWKFLTIIEDAVMAYEKVQLDVMKPIQDKQRDMARLEELGGNETKISVIRTELAGMIDEANDVVKNAAKEKHEFEFPDQEIYVQMKDVFGKIDTREVDHRTSRIYFELEDCFIEAVATK